MTNSHIIFTGGPGSGKTSLINYLATKDFSCAPESGRAVLQSQGGIALRDNDPSAYAMEMFKRDIENLKCAANSLTPILFDRGLPDVVGYLRLVGQFIPPELHSACQNHRYSGFVFSAPPWPEIYENDTERTQSFDTAIATYKAVTEAWLDYDYKLIKLPLASLNRRAKL